MLAYTIRRLLLTIPVMFVVATAVFLLLHLTPGDPVGVILGSDASEEQKVALRHRLGLDQPWYTQLVHWYGNTARGDLGTSIFLNRPVARSILDRIQPTLMLTVCASVVAIGVGLPAGIFAARRRGTWLDFGSMLVAMVGVSMPTFLLGLNLIFLFAVTLNWLPVAGYRPLSDGLWPAFRYLILPAITLGAAQGALLARMTRSMMLDVLNQDYVRTARAKGLREGSVILRHALRNALIPLITVIGLTFAVLMGGAVVTEQVFNIPGIGRLLIQAVTRRDYPLVQGVVLFIAMVYVLINLAVDLLYAVLDPRVSTK